MTDSPRLIAPPLSCDCHMHVYDPRFAASPTWPVAPPLAPASAYREVQSALGLSRCVVVQPNAYVDDNRCTEQAIAALRPGARGVAVVRPGVPDVELRRLSRAGFTGARCYVLSGGLLSFDDVEQVAADVARHGWHVDVQLDGRELPQHVARLRELPCPVVIDHNGKFLEPVAVTDPAFIALQRLLDSGKVWVKLSAPYETSRRGAPHYEDVAALARALAQSHPERCVWASNWPHPGQDPAPSTAAMLDLLLEWVDDEATRRRILVDNPQRLYGF
jgi:D-galactarolactone isomerase